LQAWPESALHLGESDLVDICLLLGRVESGDLAVVSAEGAVSRAIVDLRASVVELHLEVGTALGPRAASVEIAILVERNPELDPDVFHIFEIPLPLARHRATLPSGVLLRRRVRNLGICHYINRYTVMQRYY
jgi:hypothetical protein